VAVLFIMAILTISRPLLQDVRSHGGIRRMLSEFSAPHLSPSNLFPVALLCLLAVMLYQAAQWDFAARIVPMIAGIGAVLFCTLSLADDVFRRPGTAAAGLADTAKATIQKKIHMDVASNIQHMPVATILGRGAVFFGWMIAFLGSMATIGLIPTVPLFIICYMKLEGSERWRIAVPMAAVMTLLIYVVFDQLLTIPWPPTLAGYWFPELKAIPSV
jgi:hypothetical protein